MAKSNPPEYELHPSRESKRAHTLEESGDYIHLGPDSDGRRIYSLKARPGVYYALAHGMKMAWRVVAVKPSMLMDAKYKKPHRQNVLPVGPRGEDLDRVGLWSGMTKLSDTSIVFELRAKDLTQAQIAKEVGLSHSQISRILSGSSRSPKPSIKK